jgi:hypothetical protein
MSKKDGCKTPATPARMATEAAGWPITILMLALLGGGAPDASTCQFTGPPDTITISTLSST